MKKRPNRRRRICNGRKCELEYSFEYDSYYCTKHDTWIEDRCDDPECVFCADRPDNPGVVNDQAD